MPIVKNKKIVFIAAAILIIAVIVVIWRFLPSQTSYVVSTDPVAPSEEQKEVINAFGYPDTFMLLMEEDVRYETWVYYDMERSFIFMNGAFLEDQIIEGLENKNVSFPDFRPTQFESGLAFSGAADILGEPSAKGEIAEDVLQDAAVYNYFDQLSIGTKGDKVIFVQTFPVFVLESQ